VRSKLAWQWPHEISNGRKIESWLAKSLPAETAAR
jgi:hypothetical protein